MSNNRCKGPNILEQVVLNAENTRPEAPLSREVIVCGSSIKTVYKNTRNYTHEKFFDIYYDSENTRYKFNSFGKLVAIQISDEKVSDMLIKINKGMVNKHTDDSIATIAIEYARDIFGDMVDDYNLSDVVYYEDMYNYSVVLAKNYGEDGFVIGETIICEVFLDGTVYGCTMNCAYDLTDFNDDLVKDVSKESVESYVEKQAKALYGVAFESVEIEGIHAAKIKDRHYLEVSATVDYLKQDEFGESCNVSKVESMFYEIKE